MHVAFLDANVLFSAAHHPDSGLKKLWSLPNIEFVTSHYALEEARRNLDPGPPRARLDELIRSMRVVPGASDRPFPEGVELAEKDRPILVAAIGAGATHLLTGDVTHFGRYYGRTVGGVQIVPPAVFLGQHAEP